MGTHLRVLSESYPMNTNKIGFQCFSKIFVWTKVALTLEGLTLPEFDSSKVVSHLSLNLVKACEKVTSD